MPKARIAFPRSFLFSSSSRPTRALMSLVFVVNRSTAHDGVVRVMGISESSWPSCLSNTCIARLRSSLFSSSSRPVRRLMVLVFLSNRWAACDPCSLVCSGDDTINSVPPIWSLRQVSKFRRQSLDKPYLKAECQQHRAFDRIQFFLKRYSHSYVSQRGACSRIFIGMSFFSADLSLTLLSVKWC